MQSEASTEYKGLRQEEADDGPPPSARLSISLHSFSFLDSPS